MDVLVAGAGPAGLSLAAACAERGLDVGVLAPDPEARWVATYGGWVDEWGAEVPLDARWDEVAVRFGPDEVVPLRRAYARLDHEALRARLLDRLPGARLLRGAVVATEATQAGTSVRDDRGRVHHASLVVLATGAPTARAFQTAHGLFAELDGLDPSTPLWMDLGHRFADDPSLPTFLYALPFPDGTWLVEETALVRAPAVSHELLERRLRERLDALGVRIRSVLGTERCAIPMDADVPSPGPVARFGSAAGAVHPATGYLVARTLAAAPRVAEAVAAHLGEGPHAAARAAHEALWPADALRRHRVLRYAAGVLARLDAEDTRAFLRCFFASRPTFVAGFLGDGLTTGALVAGMAELFRRLPVRLRLRVLAAGDPGELIRAAWHPSPEAHR